MRPLDAMRRSGSSRRRPTACAAWLLAAATVAAGTAGCGTAAQLTGPKRPVAGAEQVSKVVSPAAWARAQARALARQMLARQPLPPGARRLRPGQAGSSGLVAAEQIGDRVHTIDVGRLYRVPGTEADVIAFLKRHVPAGATGLGDGSDTEGKRTARFVSYTRADTPDGVAGTLLVASMLPASSGGGTLLRIDAQVVWNLPRTAIEHVNPAGYRAVVITVPRGEPSLGVARKVFTAPAVIAEFASRLNNMHAAGGPVRFCPIFIYGYRLRFEPKSAVAKEVIATAAPCGTIDVSVGGKAQPDLIDSTGLTSLVFRLAGVPVNRPGHRIPVVK